MIEIYDFKLKYVTLNPIFSFFQRSFLSLLLFAATTYY